MEKKYNKDIAEIQSGIKNQTSPKIQKNLAQKMKSILEKYRK